jgi:PAS domain S-box-containing protein
MELREAAATGHYEDVGWRVRKDGSRFWANVVITRIRDDDGKLIGFGKITRDLTERRESEHRYRMLVEGVIDYAIFSMDKGGHVTSWNVGAERIKGYKAEEIIGKHFSTFYTPEDRAAGLPEKVLRTAAETGHFEGEGWRMRKNGTLFWSSVVVTAVRDDDGNLQGFSKVTRDVTERKQLLDALRQHSEELELRVMEREQSNAELEAFAYSVSHDLRAPLRAIAGFADALREDYDQQLDVRGRDYLAEITSAAERMNQLVQDLMEYGRVSRINLPLEPVSVRASLEEALRQLGDKGDAQIDNDLTGEVKVCGHMQVLSQVMLNLLSNAVKFHPPGVAAKVRVWSETHGEVVRIQVQDNGIGIAPRHQERIWQVFERLHDRESYPGTGIGLAIVKRAVTRMNGRVGLESEAGTGSTFWVELPRTEGCKSGDDE